MVFSISARPVAAGYYWHGLHLLALASCWLNSLAVEGRLLLMLVVFVSWSGYWRGVKPLGNRYLRYTPWEHWEMSIDGLNFVPIVVEANSVISRWIIFLHYRPLNRGQLNAGTLLIASPALPEDDFRRLLTRLKFSRKENDR